MNIAGTVRVIETDSFETANQYLRFGWNLINQVAVEATLDQPAKVKYVLASVRRLEDTREIVCTSQSEEVNEYLRLGWKLIDKFVTQAALPEGRDETMQFVLAWQQDAAVLRLGASPPATRPFDTVSDGGELL